MHLRGADPTLENHYGCLTKKCFGAIRIGIELINLCRNEQKRVLIVRLVTGYFSEMRFLPNILPNPN
jgi:hypothetical protein